MDIVDTNTDNNYGADGGTVIFATLNGQDSGLTSSARKIFYQTSNGGHTLTGFADQNLNGVYDPATDTTAIFTINLNLDKSLAIASDTYTVQMLHRVDSATISTSTAAVIISLAVTFHGPGLSPWVKR